MNCSLVYTRSCGRRTALGEQRRAVVRETYFRPPVVGTEQRNTTTAENWKGDGGDANLGYWNIEVEVIVHDRA